MTLDVETIFAISLALATAVVGFLTGWISHRSSAAERVERAEEVAARYREPLLQAAFNLQSRLYNIVRQNLLSRMHTDLRSPEAQEYVIEYTLYLIGQYLCWVEILRRETLFLDPRRKSSNRDLAESLENVRDSFAESESSTGPFRIFRGQQRAIAERMIVARAGERDGGPIMDCVGYASYIYGKDDPENARWFGQMRSELHAAGDQDLPDFSRLVAVQRALVDLMNVLDPDAQRVPSRMRATL